MVKYLYLNRVFLKLFIKKELRGSGFLERQEIEVVYFTELICATALGYETRKLKIRTAQEGKFRSI